MRYLIGINIGTSAIKIIPMDEEGNVAAQVVRDYLLYQPGNGWTEQAPEDRQQAALETLKQVAEQSGVSRGDVQGIDLSGQMHGLVILDEAGNPIRHSIIQCDQRFGQQVDEMLNLLPHEKWLEITANPPIATWTAAKLLWVKRHEPEIYAKCRHTLLPRDYIRYVLTGQFAMDVSDASGMQMLDVKGRCWPDEVLEVLGVQKEVFGKVYESRGITGRLLQSVAKKCGLTVDVKVVAGSVDNTGAAIGTGVARDGDVFTSIGASALVHTHMDYYTPIPEGSLHLCRSSVSGYWFTMGGPQAAGLSPGWFKNNYCQDYKEKAEKDGRSTYDLINEAAADIRPGNEHLVFMPYLMGEGTSHMNPRCRGVFVGLNIIRTKAYLLRTIMKGVAYPLADCNNIPRNLGIKADNMKVCGGGGRSPAWWRIMTALHSRNIIRLEQEGGPAYRAAILAGVGTGVYDDVRDVSKKLIRRGRVTVPDEEEAAVYRRYYDLYDRLYGHMKQDFNDLYELQRYGITLGK